MRRTPSDRYAELPVLSVSTLARRARLLIEEAFSFVQVEGEISNFRRPGSGHWYFTLKDQGAQLRCAMFAGNNRRVTMRPADGAQVIIRGRVSLYEARGDFQIIAEEMSAAGEGALRAAFDALKSKLEAEGLFEPQRKRPLPDLPRHLTIISSASGAALRDVLHVIERRFPALPITLIPSLVQGDGSEADLLRAFAQAAQLDTDLILLTRGGGSLEDLWSFNLESIARAIAASPHPVISAIGHQTDFTIADFVADVRAPTPSAGAELLTPAAEELNGHLANRFQRMKRAIDHQQRYAQQRLDYAGAQLIDPRTQLRQRARATNDLAHRLGLALESRVHLSGEQLRGLVGALKLLAPDRNLPAHRARLASNIGKLQRALATKLQADASALQSKARALDAVSPLNTLIRGYAVITDPSRRPITSIADTEAGERVQAFLHDGALELEVINVDDSATLTNRS